MLQRSIFVEKHKQGLPSIKKTAVRAQDDERVPIIKESTCFWCIDCTLLFGCRWLPQSIIERISIAEA
jgi:hypothetical protein